MQCIFKDSVSATFGPDYRRVDVGNIAVLAPDGGFAFDCGMTLAELPVAYQTYGELNADKSNAILVCHGLTADQYAASEHPVTGKPGWWQDFIGPNTPIDTDRYFVIVCNVLGSCMGSFGPKYYQADTQTPYGLSFPVVTIADMARAQMMVVEALGIEKLFCVIGASMGGMIALEIASHYSERLHSVMAIATSFRHSAQNIAFHEIGRQAIMADPQWQGGEYYTHKTFPAKGLAVARMTAHVTYVSEMALSQKFGRNLQDKDRVGFGFDADFQIESYLRHQGKSFVDRFDPNSYLYITRAMDYFDLEADHNGHLARAFEKSDVRFGVFSFSSDWCFPTSESRLLVRALNAVAADVSFSEIETDKGHDAFLLDVADFKRSLSGFLDGTARARGGE